MFPSGERSGSPGPGDCQANRGLSPQFFLLSTRIGARPGPQTPHLIPPYTNEVMQQAVLAAKPVVLGSSRIITTTPKRQPTLVARAVVDSSQDAFSADVIDASNAAPVIVDFHAAWCGPCKLVAPSMVWADKEYDGKLKVVKIDCTDGNKDLMEQYKVYGLPCLIMFKDGAMMDGGLREGAITKKGLAEYIEKWTGLSAAV